MPQQRECVRYVSNLALPKVTLLRIEYLVQVSGWIQTAAPARRHAARPAPAARPYTATSEPARRKRSRVSARTRACACARRHAITQAESEARGGADSPSGACERCFRRGSGIVT
eukprot:2065077-Pleurochrysis_carterae.AAC.3